MLKLLKKTVLRDMSLRNEFIVVLIHVAGDTDQDEPTWAFVNAQPEHVDRIDRMREDETVNSAASRIIKEIGLPSTNRYHSVLFDLRFGSAVGHVVSYDYMPGEIPNFTRLVADKKLVLLHDQGKIVSETHKSHPGYFNLVQLANSDRDRRFRTFARV